MGHTFKYSCKQTVRTNDFEKKLIAIAEREYINNYAPPPPIIDLPQLLVKLEFLRYCRHLYIPYKDINHFHDNFK